MASNLRRILTAAAVAAATASVVVAAPAPPGSPQIDVRLPVQANRLLELLGKTPYLLPPRPDPHRRIALVLGTIESGRVGTPETSPVLRSDLSLDRGRALDTARAPDYWLLVTDAKNAHVVYWSPVFVSRAVRAEWKEPEATEMEGRSAPRRLPTYALRIPFEPHGHVFVVEATRGAGQLALAVRAAGALGARP